MIFLGNAFSLQMLNGDCTISVKEVAPADIPADAISCIGHADTASVVSSILGKSVEVNRVSVKLTESDALYVAQVVGGRLPEGSTTIPDGMSIKFLKVTHTL